MSPPKISAQQWPEIVGASSGLRDVLALVVGVATTDVPVLILGETGSGKELIARAVHESSPRRRGPLVRVNCGAIPSDLIDSELFGHERGSFTGAIQTRRGWFERAHGGTLFLDEVGELSLAAQVRLLRVLQDGAFERVGGSEPLRADVRVVAATHRDLPGMVQSGAFRADLWFRLSVFPLRLPPLRERRQDIAELAHHFARSAATRFGLAELLPSPADLLLLRDHDWPGNVRELAAVIERAVLLGRGERLAIADSLALALPLQPPPVEQIVARQAGEPTLTEAQVQHITHALIATAGRIEGRGGAAERLGINPHTLRARMRKLEIDWSRYRR
jgi:transcriptional regulator with GAF, ATPase, and Fis domain